MANIDLNNIIGNDIKTRFTHDTQLYVFGVNKKEKSVICISKNGIQRFKVNHITEVINH